MRSKRSCKFGHGNSVNAVLFDNNFDINTLFHNKKNKQTQSTSSTSTSTSTVKTSSTHQQLLQQLQQQRQRQRQRQQGPTRSEEEEEEVEVIEEELSHLIPPGPRPFAQKAEERRAKPGIKFDDLDPSKEIGIYRIYDNHKLAQYQAKNDTIILKNLIDYGLKNIKHEDSKVKFYKDVDATKPITTTDISINDLYQEDNLYKIYVNLNNLKKACTVYYETLQKIEQIKKLRRSSTSEADLDLIYNSILEPLNTDPNCQIDETQLKNVEIKIKEVLNKCIKKINGSYVINNDISKHDIDLSFNEINKLIEQWSPVQVPNIYDMFQINVPLGPDNLFYAILAGTGHDADQKSATNLKQSLIEYIKNHINEFSDMLPANKDPLESFEELLRLNDIFHSELGHIFLRALEQRDHINIIIYVFIDNKFDRNSYILNPEQLHTEKPIGIIYLKFDISTTTKTLIASALIHNEIEPLSSIELLNRYNLINRLVRHILRASSKTDLAAISEELGDYSNLPIDITSLNNALRSMINGSKNIDIKSLLAIILKSPDKSLEPNYNSKDNLYKADKYLRRL